jgi:hypothetical protein
MSELEQRAKQALQARGIQGAELDLLTEIVVEEYHGGESAR